MANRQRIITRREDVPYDFVAVKDLNVSKKVASQLYNEAKKGGIESVKLMKHTQDRFGLVFVKKTSADLFLAPNQNENVYDEEIEHEFLTHHEAAQRLNVSTNILRRIIKQRAVKAVYFGSQELVIRKSLEEYIKKQIEKVGVEGLNIESTVADRNQNTEATAESVTKDAIDVPVLNRIDNVRYECNDIRQYCKSLDAQFKFLKNDIMDALVRTEQAFWRLEEERNQLSQITMLIFGDIVFKMNQIWEELGLEMKDGPHRVFYENRDDNPAFDDCMDDDTKVTIASLEKLIPNNTAKKE